LTILPGDPVSNVLPLAREYGLSACDAVSLELSSRHGAPLAKLDGKLKRAALKAKITIFAGKPA
jgi:predicted nucleic acid-binding protein